MALRKDLERNAAALMKTSMYGGDDPVDKTKAKTPGEHNLQTFKNIGKKIIETGLGVHNMTAMTKAFEKVERGIKDLLK